MFRRKSSKKRILYFSPEFFFFLRFPSNCRLVLHCSVGCCLTCVFQVCLLITDSGLPGGSRRARGGQARAHRGGQRGLPQRGHEDHRPTGQRGAASSRGRRPAGTPLRDPGPTLPLRDLRSRARRHGRRRFLRDRPHRLQRMPHGPLHHGPPVQVRRIRQGESPLSRSIPG